MTLLNSKPMIIDKSLARLLGLNEALVLQQLHYWIEINKKSKRNCHDGKYWTYNTYEEWQVEFPFWSVSTVKRIFKKLRDEGLILADNFNVFQMDRTLWYTINYEKLQSLGQSDTIIGSEEDVDASQNEPMQETSLNPPLPESTSEITTETYNQSISHVKEEVIKSVDGQTDGFERVIERCELYAIDETYKDAVSHAIKLLLIDVRSSKIVKIGSSLIPSSLIKKDIEKLNFHVITHAVGQFKDASRRVEIRNKIGYLKVCIYNAINEMKVDVDARLRFEGII